MTTMTNQHYHQLLSALGNIIEQGRRQAYAAVSELIIKTYWEVGKQIVEYEQKGKLRANYGKQLLIELSKDLKQKHGQGFSRSNLQYMRLFYVYYPNMPDASGKLT